MVYAGAVVGELAGLPPFTARGLGLYQGRHIYVEDLLAFESGEYRKDAPQWQVLFSPFCLQNWAPVFDSHPDKRFSQYVWNGLCHGFRLGCRKVCRVKSTSHNHPSAASQRGVVSEYIQSEWRLGRLIGPLSREVVSQVHVSPIGLIPKPHQEGKWRLIVDLSYPRGSSVNAGISEELASISYMHMDDVVECIQTLGSSILMVKIDLESAYRQIPVHPSDHHRLGIEWEGQTYIDRALPFGLRSAPKIFSAVADMMTWALYRAGITLVSHYLDDFLILVPPVSGDGVELRALALSTFAHLGVPVSAHKTAGPDRVITFLGIEIDTNAGRLRLPEVKLHRLQEMIRSWVGRRSTTRKDLESFLGHLCHAATVVRSGRSFLRALFALLQQAKQPHHFIRLTAGARADILWWRCLLGHWSGSSVFASVPISCHIHTDASGSWGCGAVAEGLGWFQFSWPPHWDKVDISTKELVPIAVAAAVWGPSWVGKHVRFHSDNAAVVACVQKRSAKSPPLVQLLRCISLYGAYYGFQISAEHVPGVVNVVADALSRDRADLVSPIISQIPETPIPPQVHHLLIVERPNWGSEAWTTLFASSLSTVLRSQLEESTSQGKDVTSPSASSQP